MTALETNQLSAFETTLSSNVGATDVVYPVVSTGGGTSPMYLVFEPASDAQREIVLCDGTFDATNFRSTNVNKRHLTGSAAPSGLTHASGTTVRCCPVPQHFTDVYDLISAADQSAVVDAKGDLLVGTAADTLTRLAVGTAGLLVPDTTATSGLAWSNTVKPTSASAVALLLQLLATQTGAAIQVKASGATTVFEVDADGDVLARTLRLFADGTADLLILDRNNASVMRSRVRFRQQGAARWELGIDRDSNNQRNFYLEDNVANALRFLIDPNGNVGLMGVSSDFGGGQRVVALRDTASAPTSNPTTGSLLYSASQVFKVRDVEGVKTPVGRELVDAKGDLLVGTAADTLARKAVGTDGYALTADATTSDGLAWANLAPTGAMTAFGGSSAPTGWLLCDGSAVSRTTYAALFAVLGTTHGSGDGSSTFNLPNLKGRIPVGRDSAQSEFDTLGESGGSKTHTLTSAEMPAHTHTTIVSRDVSPGSGLKTPWSDGTAVNGRATSSTGGGGAHNNLQPYVVVNWIVKT